MGFGSHISQSKICTVKHHIVRSSPDANPIASFTASLFGSFTNTLGKYVDVDAEIQE